jgi:glyoxylase-like metal-dependent hydrolase (beta-lactamase superfamily II)
MFYRLEQITPHITRIWDVSGTAMYLVVGSESALLIDTGIGVGSLKAMVESITTKPITVLLTHGHVDHAMGAGEFERVYMRTADIPVYKNHSGMTVRQGYVSGAAMLGADPRLLAQVQASDYLAVKDAENILPLSDRRVFSLGDISVEVFAAPGHTPGSVVALIPQERILILGDACNAFTYLFDEYCPSVAQYKENLLRLQAETDDKYDRTLYSHGMGEGTVHMIANVIAVCDDILSGKTDAVPFHGVNGELVRIAKAMDFKRFGRVDGGEGNIIYDPNKIR